MNWFKWIVLSAAILAPAIAAPIGRSGNGKIVSLEDGFSTIMPSVLPEYATALDGSMTLSNSKVIDSTQSSPSVYINRFVSFYPTRAKMDRDTLKIDLVSNGWLPGSLPQEPCIDLYTSDRGNASATVAVWGEGKGVAFVSSKSEFNAYAIDQMVQNLSLDKGACAWK